MYLGSAAAYKVPSAELAWVCEEGGAELPEAPAPMSRPEELVETDDLSEEAEEEEKGDHPSLKGSFIEDDPNTTREMFVLLFFFLAFL